MFQNRGTCEEKNPANGTEHHAKLVSRIARNNMVIVVSITTTKGCGWMNELHERRKAADRHHPNKQHSNKKILLRSLLCAKRLLGVVPGRSSKTRGCCKTIEKSSTSTDMGVVLYSEARYYVVVAQKPKPPEPGFGALVAFRSHFVSCQFFPLCFAP
jgi:hypothetical protein